MMGKEVMMCGTASFLFLLLAFVFTCLKEKAAMLISGFNTLSKEERKKYDTERMSRDQRNLFLIWAAILGAGALLSCFISKYMAVIAFVIWLVVFFRDVHLDEEKAFGKYKK